MCVCSTLPKPAKICAHVASFPAIELRARGTGLYWFSKQYSILIEISDIAWYYRARVAFFCTTVVKMNADKFNVHRTQLTFHRLISYGFQVKIPGTYNYKLVVECVDPSHILMRRDRAEAICDTDTGILSTTKLTACARTIKPSTN